MESDKKIESLIFNKRSVIMVVSALFLIIFSQMYKNQFYICIQKDCKVNVELISHVALEVAFALIIAFFVTIGIEHQSRLIDLNEKERMRREVGEDVFRGLFRMDLPESYVDAVIGGILKIDIIRDYMRIYDKVEMDVNNEKLKLTRKSLYSVRNVSSHSISHNVIMEFFDRDPKDLDRTAVFGLKIDGKEFIKSEIDAARKVNPESGVIRYEFPTVILPGNSVNVEYYAVMFKLYDDQELFGVLYPCMKLSYNIKFAIPVFRLSLTERCITPASRIIYDIEGGMGDWEINGPMLKDNSVMVLWECKK